MAKYAYSAYSAYSYEKMPKMSQYYRVKDIEKLIDRDKTTLFRWEKEGKIVPPQRDSRGWRLYTEEDVEKMKQLISFNVRFGSY